MSTAKVESVEILRRFRAALIRFAEGSGTTLSDGAADGHGTLNWLERVQGPYWLAQVRKRHDAVERAREALRHKQLFKGPAGERQSVVDEQKALSRAQRALEEAEEKVAAVRRSMQRLRRAILDYEGQTQRLASTLSRDVPQAVAQLDHMIDALQRYTRTEGPAEVTSAAAGAEVQAHWSDLRDLCPTPAQRDAAVQGIEAFASWRSGKISESQRELVNALAVERTEPEASQRVVLAPDVALHEWIFLCRTTSDHRDDSGWYMAPTRAKPPEKLQWLSVQKLIAMRPDFQDILKLPHGTLVVIGPSGIEAIVDSAGANLWTGGAHGR